MRFLNGDNIDRDSFGEFLGELIRLDKTPSRANQFFLMAADALAVYSKARIEGARLDDYAPVSRIIRGTIFSALWSWHEYLTVEQRAGIADTIQSLHVASNRRFKVMCRCEFAFLTAWKSTGLWCEGSLSDYDNLEHGLDDLNDIFLAYDGDVALRTILGLGRGRTKWEKLSRRGLDSDSVRGEVGLPIGQYNEIVRPSSGRVIDEVKAVLGSWWQRRTFQMEHEEDN